MKSTRRKRLKGTNVVRVGVALRGTKGERKQMLVLQDFRDRLITALLDIGEVARHPILRKDKDYSISHTEDAGDGEKTLVGWGFEVTVDDPVIASLEVDCYWQLQGRVIRVMRHWFRRANQKDPDGTVHKDTLIAWVDNLFVVVTKDALLLETVAEWLADYVPEGLLKKEE